MTTVDLWSQTGQPVGIEQLLDGYNYNAAIAIVSAQGGDALVTLDIMRLDGTLVDMWTETIGMLQGWVTMGGIAWSYATEDILVYRLTTTGPGTVQVDFVLVGLAT
ncbi:MAG: hypothetical protein GWP18_06265 [Proteobacteria bacterium]|nr:hypothetical protein [Pseudomonadota bacterium]